MACKKKLSDTKVKAVSGGRRRPRAAENKEQTKNKDTVKRTERW